MIALKAPTKAQSLSPFCHQYACALGSPWHYRRAGVYYLRLRPKGQTEPSTSLSLRTRNRQTAMTVSKLLQSTLGAFQLDNPNATWEQLAEHLKDIAENILATHTHRDNLEDMASLYSEWRSDLGEIAITAALTTPQAKAAVMGGRIMQAAERRLAGEPMELVGIIEELTQECSTSVPLACSSLSVGAPSAIPGETTSEHLTFRALADLYIAERAGNVAEGTIKSIRTDCNILSAALGGLNMKTHTRTDMIAVKAKVMEGRKDLTVNKVLTRLTTICTWAKNSGYLDKTYEKGLKLSNAESDREAFSPNQIEALMAHANSMPTSDWQRWALSLGVITGARIGELYQLTKRDIRQAGTTWVMDVNNEGEKTLKNKHSVRSVPLTDGAFGFDLKAFLAWVDESQGRLFTAKHHYFNKPLNDLIRTILGLESGSTQTFHSLRHNLAGSLRAVETPAATAQDILGHSSGSISYDLYGAGSSVAVERMAGALKMALGVVLVEGAAQ
jgi:integrase